MLLENVCIQICSWSMYAFKYAPGVCVHSNTPRVYLTYLTRNTVIDSLIKLYSFYGPEPYGPAG